MSTSVCLSLVISTNAPNRPAQGLISREFITRKTNWMSDATYTTKTSPFVVLKATTDDKPSTKSFSLVCTQCEGNGNIKCSQCKGNGINSVDHFNGQYKAGAMCWLCRGKREILCGNCNGAGFMGGFLSTCDD